MSEELKKIEKFIKDNKLDFTGSGSDLNGACVTLAGFSLYVDVDERELMEYLQDLPIEDFTGDAYNEFERVYEYACQNNYGNYWHKNKYMHDYIY